MQISQQIRCLLLTQSIAQRRHQVAPMLNGVRHPLIIRRSPTRQVRLLENPNQRRPMQRLVHAVVMAPRTFTAVHSAASTLLLRQLFERLRRRKVLAASKEGYSPNGGSPLKRR